MCDIKAFSPILNNVQVEHRLLEIRCSGDTDYYVCSLEYYDTMFFHVKSIKSDDEFIINRDKIISIKILPKKEAK